MGRMIKQKDELRKILSLAANTLNDDKKAAKVGDANNLTNSTAVTANEKKKTTTINFYKKQREERRNKSQYNLEKLKNSA